MKVDLAALHLQRNASRLFLWNRETVDRLRVNPKKEIGKRNQREMRKQKKRKNRTKEKKQDLPGKELQSPGPQWAANPCFWRCVYYRTPPSREGPTHFGWRVLTARCRECCAQALPPPPRVGKTGQGGKATYFDYPKLWRAGRSSAETPANKAQSTVPGALMKMPVSVTRAALFHRLPEDVMPVSAFLVVKLSLVVSLTLYLFASV